MAKTTRKTEIPGTEPKARQARRKPAEAPAMRSAKAAVQTSAKAPAESSAARAAKAAKATKKRTAPASRTTTRKASTIAVAPAVAADRQAAVASMPVAEPTHGEIAERAYHIFLRRHGWPGNPDHDWLQAIEELRAERRRR